MEIYKVMINCDVGESYGRFTVGNDELIMPYLDACNIACGFHAGDPATILQTIQWALEHNVRIGAHPGYPDLLGFGRRTMQMSSEDLFAAIMYQVSVIKGMTESLGGKFHHVKPHGALYHDLGKNRELAVDFCRAYALIDPNGIVFTHPGSELLEVGTQFGLQVWQEGFADRRYEENGLLRSRHLAGAILENPEDAGQQGCQIAQENKVTTITGKIIPLKVETICIHGDHPSALTIVKKIRQRIIKR